MKTYSEEKGHPATDWGKELGWIKGIIDNFPPEGLSEEDDYRISSLAEDAQGSWVTCAVGNQCSIIPRNHYGEPEDPELREHGLEFAQNMSAIEEALYEKDTEIALIH